MHLLIVTGEPELKKSKYVPVCQRYIRVQIGPTAGEGQDIGDCKGFPTGCTKMAFAMVRRTGVAQALEPDVRNNRLELPLLMLYGRRDNECGHEGTNPAGSQHGTPY